ncbi:MAG: FAD-dependent oxidoreductase [Planctomycetota bacterium]|nr:FAD-dependent oxidoreductase [Planctomycetota bacterium]
MAVIGAGLSGLSAARTLRDRGHEVRIFDKGRGVGGRTATRRSDPFAFDHGAQYFTVRNDRFARLVAAWREAGIVAPWPGRIAVLKHGACETANPQERYVGVPGMNAIATRLAEDLDITLQTRITELAREADAWRLADESGPIAGAFDVLIVALPAAQAAELIGGLSDLAESARACTIAPCWAVMLGFDRPPTTGFDGAFVHDSPLSWIACNSSKPGRGAAESWVLHAGPAWSEAHLEDARETVVTALTDAFEQVAGLGPLRPVHADAHRWRYALPPEPLGAGALWDADKRIAVCGDWCHGARIEGAFLSGLSAAGVVPGPAEAQGNEPGETPDIPERDQ